MQTQKSVNRPAVHALNTARKNVRYRTLPVVGARHCTIRTECVHIFSSGLFRRRNGSNDVIELIDPFPLELPGVFCSVNNGVFL